MHITRMDASDPSAVYHVQKKIALESVLYDEELAELLGEKVMASHRASRRRKREFHS